MGNKDNERSEIKKVGKVEILLYNEDGTIIARVKCADVKDANELLTGLFKTK